jgi:hypothetical protein
VMNEASFDIHSTIQLLTSTDALHTMLLGTCYS